REPDGAGPPRPERRGPGRAGCRRLALRGEQGGRAREGRASRGGDHERGDRPLRACRSCWDGRVQAGAAGRPRLRPEPGMREQRTADSGQLGYVLLEDGARFDGNLWGPASAVTGEVVFNTSMTGYQEAVTDPSYAG